MSAWSSWSSEIILRAPPSLSPRLGSISPRDMLSSYGLRIPSALNISRLRLSSPRPALPYASGSRPCSPGQYLPQGHPDHRHLVRLDHRPGGGTVVFSCPPPANFGSELGSDPGRPGAGAYFGPPAAGAARPSHWSALALPSRRLPV